MTRAAFDQIDHAVYAVNEIYDQIDYCQSVMGPDGCMHCRQKEFLGNLACAWAFDLGMLKGWCPYCDGGYP